MRPAPPTTAGADTRNDHLRGSALLLFGQMAGLVIALATQVLLVRALTRDEFGRLSFALAAVVVLQALLSLGVDRADIRFLARYELEGDIARLTGTFLIEAVVLFCSVAVAVAVAAAATTGLLASLVPTALSTALAVAVFLVPLQLLDVFVVNALAVFARPRDVFVRRYVLEPGLRLGAAIVAAATGGGAVTVVVGFILGGAVATTVYVWMLLSLLRRRELLPRNSAPKIIVPWRPVLAFCTPLIIANMTAVAATDLAAVVLAHYRPATEVAAFRAVQPFAALGLIVLFSFGTLYTAAASRLHGSGDIGALRELHWRTTLWVVVLSWPVFALTSVFAAPVVDVLLGSRYAGASNLLAMLSVAAYVNAACGPNGTTVQILGRVRWMLSTNIVGLLTLIVLTVLLVPTYGASGAAVAVLVCALLFNAAKQLGLRGEVGVISRRYALALLRIGVATALCGAAAAVGPHSLGYAIAVVAVVGALLLRTSRADLQIATTFPALGQVPVLRRLVS